MFTLEGRDIEQPLTVHGGGAERVLQVVNDHRTQLTLQFMCAEQRVPLFADQRVAREKLVLERLETEERADADLQLRSLDGLHQEVVRTHVDRASVDLGLAKRGQEDDRCSFAARQGTQAAAGLEAVHGGHLDVEQHEINRRAAARRT